MIKVTCYKTEKVVLRFSSTERAQYRNAHVLVLLELDAGILCTPEPAIHFPLREMTTLAGIATIKDYDAHFTLT
jgi:hypothetical protein